MLRHQNVARNDKAKAKARCLKLALESAVGRGVVQERLPTITTESEKVTAAGLLVSDEPGGHDGGSLLQGGGLGMLEPILRWWFCVMQKSSCPRSIHPTHPRKGTGMDGAPDHCSASREGGAVGEGDGDLLDGSVAAEGDDKQRKRRMANKGNSFEVHLSRKRIAPNVSGKPDQALTSSALRNVLRPSALAR